MQIYNVIDISASTHLTVHIRRDDVSDFYESICCNPSMAPFCLEDSCVYTSVICVKVEP